MCVTVNKIQYGQNIGMSIWYERDKHERTKEQKKKKIKKKDGTVDLVKTEKKNCIEQL